MTKILVVEDESIVAKDLELTLKRLGYAVPATAASADDALTKAGQYRPDLVLMDINLQGPSDGIATAMRLRAEMNIPVIYLTAYADADTVARARESEPFGYLVKPFNELELRSTLEIAIYKHESDARLRHTDRMVSIGTMAAGIAHEINNPLSYVIANLEFVSRSLDAATLDLTRRPPVAVGADPLIQQLRDATSALSDATGGADRVRRIVADLTKLARMEEPGRAPIDLWDTLDSAIRLCAPQLQHRAHVIRERGRVALVSGSAARLEQVFINLLVNAAQAMPEGRVQANRIRVATRTDEAGCAVVEIEDTGAGISPRDQPRIFDPFFTTQPVGRGAGLGLSVCHGIISELGGRIAVESALGQGTLVRVTFPAAITEPARSALPPIPSPTATPRAQILVIDDEAKVLTLLDRLLSRRHDVTLASDGMEALALIIAGRRFDLVLCDLIMPNLTGMELFERVKEVAPEQAPSFMFLSGGAVDKRGQEFLNAHADRLFNKPFRLDDLEAMVASRLREKE